MALSDEYSCSCERYRPHTFRDESSNTGVLDSISETDSNDDNDIMLYPTLDYIKQILLEEDNNVQFVGHQEARDLSNIEKSFYDVLEEKPPSLANQSEVERPQLNSNSTTLVGRDKVIPCSNSMSSTRDSEIESLLFKEFQKGMEEGIKFLPTMNNLETNMHVSDLSLDPAQKNNNMLPKYILKEKNSHGCVDSRRSRKKNDLEVNISEGRNRKVSMLYYEEPVRDEMFDEVLLDHGEEYTRREVSRVRELMKCDANSRRNKNQEDHMDLEPLLIQCSEAVACNHRKVAEELIREIRKQASPIGKGDQRLACILADGLEARLVGTGSETYRRLVSRQISTRETLEAYHMYITASPVLRVSYCIANKHICKVAENSSKIHIIDLGINFGFQWPPLIQALGKRKGGAPKLQITGVDLPQPGFRPAERIKQTGFRLEEYAKTFGVPFEYQCVASLWESISAEDFKIKDDEVLIVNSMFRFKQVRDETFDMNSPRNRVLKLINQIKPKMFILGIFNVFFSPFFTKRFKNVLIHYSKLFDMFDTLVPRDDKRRQLMERELVAPSIINLVACEGYDWVVRPERHEEWNKRLSRAGFEQLTLDCNIIDYCNKKVKSGYHEKFFIEENCGWLLQGWKGSVDRAVSIWKPK